MKPRIIAALAVVLVANALIIPSLRGQRRHQNVIIDLWTQGKTAFGVYAPSENQPPRGDTPRGETGRGRLPAPAPRYTREGGEKLAQNPLYDFVFLNLEGNYDANAVKQIAQGLRSRSAVSRKTLLVRIPPIDRDGANAAKARIKEALDSGADGVVIPHIQNIEEAKQAISFFAAAKADVWSPSNRNGEKIAMLMIEDPGSLAQASEIADLKGYSILACGIGSLTGALGGDRVAAEAGNQKILAESKRVGLADMITANASDIEKRVKEGFLALLMQGPTADDTIKIGRAAAGR